MIAHRPPSRNDGVFAVQTITCPSVPSATVPTFGRPPPTRPLHDVNLGGLQFRPMGNVGIWMRVVLVCETLTPHPSGHRAKFVSSPSHHHDAKTLAWAWSTLYLAREQSPVPSRLAVLNRAGVFAALHTERGLSRAVSRILRSMDLAFIVEENKC